MTQAHETPIAIVFASDNGYAMPLAATMASVIANTPETPLAFFIIDGGITDVNKTKIATVLNAKWHTIDWLQPQEEVIETLKLQLYLTKACYYRILIPALLPTTFHKAIYLDCDLIVKQDLRKLWSIDIEDNALLAVQDVGLPYVSSPGAIAKYQELGIPAKAKHFNSGMLVFNLDKWRAESIADRVFEYLIKYHEFVNYHDQDGLNAVLSAQWGELDPRWNQTPGVYDFTDWHASPYSSAEILANVQDDPYIIHFTGSCKPWNCIHNRDRITFYTYMDMTPWKGWRYSAWHAFQKKIVTSKLGKQIFRRGTKQQRLLQVK